MNLKDKNILVTGGSRGIGASICKYLSSKGANIVLTYTSRPDAAEGIFKELSQGNHKTLQLNLQDESSIESAFKETLAHFNNKLDGLVNNAGITKDQILLRMKTEEFDQVIQTNLRGTFLCTKMALKPMMKARGGSIVHITSVVGQMGHQGQANYAASKAGVEAFSKSVALEMASRQVRSNCVAPGFIDTEMTGELTEEQREALLKVIPLGHMAPPEAVASSVGFLLSDESNYITGQTLSVNGGMYMN